MESSPGLMGPDPLDAILGNMHNDSSVMFYMLPTQQAQRERSRSPNRKKKQWENDKGNKRMEEAELVFPAGRPEEGKVQGPAMELWQVAHCPQRLRKCHARRQEDLFQLQHLHL